MPPIPGWLVEGLWVLDQEAGSLLKVTKTTRNFISLSTPDGSCGHRTRLTYLSRLFFASNFYPCDDCRKGGLTCEDCARRKVQFETGPRVGGRRWCDLPKLCKRKFVGGSVPLHPHEEPDPSKQPLPPTRFEREWVI